jgi:hypothetical protein
MDTKDIRFEEAVSEIDNLLEQALGVSADAEGPIDIDRTLRMLQGAQRLLEQASELRGALAVAARAQGATFTSIGSQMAMSESGGMRVIMRHINMPRPIGNAPRHGEIDLFHA